ncbi:MAG: hypothetical protein ACP5NQ_07495, partial [Vulcanisaeta sp.]
FSLEIFELAEEALRIFGRKPSILFRDFLCRYFISLLISLSSHELVKYWNRHAYVRLRHVFVPTVCLAELLFF